MALVQHVSGLVLALIWIVLGLDLRLFYAQVIACLCGL